MAHRNKSGQTASYRLEPPMYDQETFFGARERVGRGDVPGGDSDIHNRRLVMAKRAKSYVDKNGMAHITAPICLDTSSENADWIKVAGWFRTFSDEERHLLETLRGCSSSLCNRAWLAQRQYRLSHGKSGTEIVTDPELHKALILMRAAGIPCDRMHPDDEEFGDYMKEPVP